MKIILLAGAPGSGKSTQGTALMKINSRIKHLSLGDVVRDILKNPAHPITCKYQEWIKDGNLLPDEVIAEILQSELEKIADKNTVLLLDGYPRTSTQYEQFKTKWGLPSGLIHLDVDEVSLNERLLNRQSARSDDNEKAIAKRLDFFRTTTKPLLENIKQDLNKSAITVNTSDSIKSTSLYLYAHLQRIADVHDLLKMDVPEEGAKVEINGTVKPVWTYSLFSQLWQKGNEYQAVDSIQKSYDTRNFSCSLMGTKIVYLETTAEVKSVLEARSNLGPVYRHFSLAAGLHHDFVATDSHNADSYRLDNQQVNMWKLIHNAFGIAVKNDRNRIENLMDKHLNQTFFAEKTFDLDTTFDNFFCSFWSEYLFGNVVSAGSYMENREQLLAAMRHCFYNNNYKGLDPTGLSSFIYSYAVQRELNQAKANIKTFIAKSTPASLVQRFKSALNELNEKEHLELSSETIDEIIADNVFDFIFEPDFLENVMYEALVVAIKDNADLHDKEIRNKVYAKGLQQGFLYPIRSRVLEEPVALADGSVLPEGSIVYLNLKKAGLFHSAGARRCVGQAYTHYFKDHFFDRMESIDFKVKKISMPKERVRLSGTDNVPVSPERYQVSWRLKRDEAMRHLSFHNYKGNKFFDVLSLHQKPGLNAHMVKQCILKINRFVQKNGIDWHDVVIVTPEVRGIPIAAQVADHLSLPLYTIRKKGGYKMAPEEVYTESYDKGYGDKDEVELPIEKVKEIAGKKIIFIDDGIASGKSALACIKLLEKHGEEGEKSAEVPMILTLLKHDYTPMDPKLTEHRLVKTLFDCKGGSTQPVQAKEQVSAVQMSI